MSATNAPFGLRPAYHPSGLDRATVLAGGIPSGYATQILKGQPVKYNSSGQIVPAAAGDSFVGAFAGVEFTDSTGRYRVSNYWPASQSLATNTVATAYFYSDPLIVYEIQADGSLAQTAIGDQADFTNITAGSSTTGLSPATLSTTLVGAGNSAQMRIVDIAPYPGNAWGDAYTIVRVTINESQVQATVNAF